MVRDKVQAKVIKLIHVKTQCQLADLLTNALYFKQFSELLSKMGLINIHQPLVHIKGEYQGHSKKSTTRQASQAVIQDKQEDATEAPSCRIHKMKGKDVEEKNKNTLFQITINVKKFS